jgi:glutathionylspermidine synthase
MEAAVPCPVLQNHKPVPDLRAGPLIDPAAFSKIRRRAVLEGCKWDPQVGDLDTLAPFPLVMNASVWRQLATDAERLTAEAISAEEEISRQPQLLDDLGLPRALRKILADHAPLSPGAGRVMRFDFHPTTEGWKISEANSDVPGGFSEASHFTALVAEHFPGLSPSGNPAELWSETLAATAGRNGVIALLSAPGYMEDHQVTAFLAGKLRESGCRAHLAKPEQVLWQDGVAHLDTAWHRGPVNAIVKFYQAEWLSRLPARFDWHQFFRGGKTPVANPPLAAIAESKRFPLVWDRLSARLPTWRRLLPESRDPRKAPWSRDESWLLKTAMCNNGDTVSIRELMKPKDWLQTRLSARLLPGNWLAQRRFESVPVITPVGKRHVCIGVYTVNGKAAGAYARLSEKPIIDFAAVDVALLLRDDE